MRRFLPVLIALALLAIGGTATVWSVVSHEPRLEVMPDDTDTNTPSPKPSE
jgi:hypothetical protein